MNKVKFIICILLLVSVRSIYSNEAKWNTRPRSELLDDSSELITKVKFLESNGYCLSQKSPSFFTGEVYNMVYWEINDMGRIGYSLEESEIVYTLMYALNKPDDPNYFVYAFFIIDDTIYFFFKINFFLEYGSERIWKKPNGSETMIKMFY